MIALSQLKVDASKLVCLMVLASVWGTYDCEDIDIRDILMQAAQKLAVDAGTTINTEELAHGYCFSHDERIPGRTHGCQDEPGGKQLMST